MPSSPHVFKGIAIVAILFSLGIVATALAGYLGLDVKLSSLFYEQGGIHGGWIYARDMPWRELYDYGEIPAVVMAIGSLGLAIAARVGKAPRIYVRPCLVVMLTVIIGPGIIVNGWLKGCYGRPRPADVRVFNGDWDYREAWEPGVPVMGKSLHLWALLRGIFHGFSGRVLSIPSGSGRRCSCGGGTIRNCFRSGENGSGRPFLLPMCSGRGSLFLS
jgi:membrane-associated PAP2 superfamily phosphatase